MLSFHTHWMMKHTPDGPVEMWTLVVPTADRRVNCTCTYGELQQGVEQGDETLIIGRHISLGILQRVAHSSLSSHVHYVSEVVLAHEIL